MVRAIIAVLWVGLSVAGASAQEPKLTFLQKNVTSPHMTATMNGVHPTGREQNLGGWMVLNGARFRNSDFPELAKGLVRTTPRRATKIPIPILRSCPRTFSKPLPTVTFSEAWRSALVASYAVASWAC